MGATATLYTVPLVIDRSTQVIARTLDGGNWSGLPAEATFSLTSYATAMRITEIMYNPLDSGSEFVELCNISSGPLDISGWDLDGISGFAFPAATSLPAGGYVVLVDSVTTTPEQFRIDFNVPAGVPIFAAPFDLGNAGEALQLEKPNPDPLEPDVIIERVRYNDKAP